MKLFAITPEACRTRDLLQRLEYLSSRGVDYIYLRSQVLLERPAEACRHILAAGMVPLVPCVKPRSDIPRGCGFHFPGGATGLLPVSPDRTTVITASCHSEAAAANLLEHGQATYVFVSPVFQPLSKPGDQRRPFPRRGLQRLAAAWGERVVLLGGMTAERIEQLRASLSGDFSVGGITLFFEDLT